MPQYLSIQLDGGPPPSFLLQPGSVRSAIDACRAVKMNFFRRRSICVSRQWNTATSVAGAVYDDDRYEHGPQCSIAATPRSAAPIPRTPPSSRPTARSQAIRRRTAGGPSDLAIFLAGLHASVVFSLACLRGVIFHAGLLLIPTLLATARLFGSCCNSDATNTEQHNDNGSDSWHDDLLSMLATAATRSSLLRVVFSSCCSLCLSRF